MSRILRLTPRGEHLGGEGEEVQGMFLCNSVNSGPILPVGKILQSVEPWLQIGALPPFFNSKQLKLGVLSKNSRGYPTLKHFLVAHTFSALFIQSKTTE